MEREAEFNARAETDPANRKSENTPDALSDDWIGTWCLYGSPETVIEHLQPYKDLGIGNVLCGTTTGLSAATCNTSGPAAMSGLR